MNFGMIRLQNRVAATCGERVTNDAEGPGQETLEKFGKVGHSLRDCLFRLQHESMRSFEG
jgi:hypothetical protein